MTRPDRPRVLLAGGAGGFVGRALASELLRDHRIRSVHRSSQPGERGTGIEVVEADIAGPTEWGPILRDVDYVVNVAWYRAGPEGVFRRLFEGLERMLSACQRASVPRFIQISVPDAPADLERGFPYLVYKRRFDRSVAQSGLPYAILRPSALFGPGDKLLGVMLRSIHRYPFFPMFGDGAYHLSPLAVGDLARIVRWSLEVPDQGSFDLGGPVAYRYRDLTDAMFALLGKRPRYWRLSPQGSLRLAGLLESLGSTLLYRYEVEWLMSDRLGLAPAAMIDAPLARVEPYLGGLAAQFHGPPPASAAGTGTGR